MAAHRIAALAALAALGCSSVLGIDEKQKVAVVVDSGVPMDGAVPGDGGSFALSIVKPPARADGTRSPVHLVRGSAASIDVAIERSGGFSGAVFVAVSGLSTGITADPLVIHPADSAGSLTMHASATAELGPASLSILGMHEDVVSDPLDVPLIVQDAPGSPDKTFGDGGKVVLPVGTGGVGPGGLRLQPNGSLILCGHAKTDTAPSSIVVSRIQSSGVLDPAFAMGAGFALGNIPGSKTDACDAVFLRPNGGIVFTGFATPEANQPRAMLTGRYRPDGFPDANFGSAPSGGFGTTLFDGTGSEGYSVVGPTMNDTFVVGGWGRGRPALLRFNKNGALDANFGTENAQDLSVPGGIRWVAQQPSGNFVAAIDAATFLVARFSSSGSLDKSFGDGGTKSIPAGGQSSSAAVALAPSDDVYFAVGTETIAPGATDIAVARLTSAGQSDPAFGTAGIATIHFPGASIVSSAIERDGAIVIAGQSSTEAGKAFTVLRVSSSGTLDTTFGTGGRAVLGVGMAQAITVDDLGRIVVAGFSGGENEGTLVVYRLWP